jgi:hypothetical protein
LNLPNPFQIEISPPVSWRKFSFALHSLPRTVEVEGGELQVGARRGNHLHQGCTPGGRVPVPLAGGAAVRDSGNGAEGAIEEDSGLDIDARRVLYVVQLAGCLRGP